MIKHTMFANGAVKNAAGKLVAFYDREAKQLSIDGFALTFFAEDETHAMEIVGRRCA
jgi:hypothetical protein